MNRSVPTTSHWLAALLAAAALLLQPASSWAASWLGFRNDLNAPVIIQGVSQVNNKPGNVGKPHVLYAGEVSWESVVQPGNKIITVYDAKTRRALFQTTITCTGDQLLAAQFDSATRKIKLVPVKIPAKKKPSRP